MSGLLAELIEALKGLSIAQTSQSGTSADTLVTLSAKVETDSIYLGLVDAQVAGLIGELDSATARLRSHIDQLRQRGNGANSEVTDLQLIHAMIALLENLAANELQKSQGYLAARKLEIQAFVSVSQSDATTTELFRVNSAALEKQKELAAKLPEVIQSAKDTLAGLKEVLLSVNHELEIQPAIKTARKDRENALNMATPLSSVANSVDSHKVVHAAPPHGEVDHSLRSESKAVLLQTMFPEISGLGGAEVDASSVASRVSELEAEFEAILGNKQSRINALSAYREACEGLLVAHMADSSGTDSEEVEQCIHRGLELARIVNSDDLHLASLVSTVSRLQEVIKGMHPQAVTEWASEKLAELALIDFKAKEYTAELRDAREATRRELKILRGGLMRTIKEHKTERDEPDKAKMKQASEQISAELKAIEERVTAAMLIAEPQLKAIATEFSRCKQLIRTLPTEKDARELSLSEARACIEHVREMVIAFPPNKTEVEEIALSFTKIRESVGTMEQTSFSIKAQQRREISKIYRKFRPADPVRNQILLEDLVKLEDELNRSLSTSVKQATRLHALKALYRPESLLLRSHLSGNTDDNEQEADQLGREAIVDGPEPYWQSISRGLSDF